MTRKHFRDLANALAAVRPAKNNSNAYHTWVDTVLAVSNVCRRHNDNFDSDRFYTACGFTVEP